MPSQRSTGLVYLPDAAGGKCGGCSASAARSSALSATLRAHAIGNVVSIVLGRVGLCRFLHLHFVGLKR